MHKTSLAKADQCNAVQDQSGPGFAQLTQAKQCLLASTANLRDAANYIHEAQELGIPQRDIAGELGKKKSWVCAILAWRANDFKGLPFAEDSKAKRERKKRVNEPVVQATGQAGTSTPTGAGQEVLNSEVMESEQKPSGYPPSVGNERTDECSLPERDTPLPANDDIPLALIRSPALILQRLDDSWTINMLPGLKNLSRTDRIDFLSARIRRDLKMSVQFPQD